MVCTGKSQRLLLEWAWLTGTKGFPGGSIGKESACNAGDMGLIPELVRSPGGGNGNPLQYSYLGNPMDRGAWWAAVHGGCNSWTWLINLITTTYQLLTIQSNFTLYLRTSDHAFSLQKPKKKKKISGWEDPLEKGIAAHSSILVWRIPWKKDPGMLQSVGSLMGQTWLQWFVLYPCNGYKTDLELWSYPCPWVNWGKFFLRSKEEGASLCGVTAA